MVVVIEDVGVDVKMERWTGIRLQAAEGLQTGANSSAKLIADVPAHRTVD